MPRLPRISGSAAVRALERLGFYRARQTGSHVVLKKPIEEGEIVCVIPLRRELKVGTRARHSPSSPSLTRRVYRKFVSDREVWKTMRSLECHNRKTLV